MLKRLLIVCGVLAAAVSTANAGCKGTTNAFGPKTHLIECSAERGSGPNFGTIIAGIGQRNIVSVAPLSFAPSVRNDGTFDATSWLVITW